MPMKKKTFIAAIICAIISVCAVISVTYAQNSTPLIPEFGLEFIGQTFYPAPTSSINPSTGENTTIMGYQVEKDVIKIKILNPPFQPSAENVKIYFNVRVKEHFESVWTEIYHYDSQSPGTLPPLSNVFYGVLSMPTHTVLSYPTANCPKSAQLDFQVKALIGAYTRSEPSAFSIVAESDWSNTQTITLPSPAIEYNQTQAAASASFESFFGYFNVTSPSNVTYNQNILNLNVTGNVIVASNVRLIMEYSLDDQERTPLPIMIREESPMPPQGAINGSIILPQWTEGSHKITVYGDLEFNGPHLAQAAVYFTVNTQPSQTPTLSPIPTPSLSPTPTPEPSSSPSPTQQPTLEPNSSDSPTLIIDNFPNYPLYLLLGIVVVVIAAIIGVLVYFKRR
jgi:hypothetical protein